MARIVVLGSSGAPPLVLEISSGPAFIELVVLVCRLGRDTTFIFPTPWYNARFGFGCLR